ncbi:MAG TPA: PEP-CTERM/exosortase system-associated acyltransferase [Thermodesulfobacteriota bacterium]|nr:PEP-CTERM/exosortase system-associated acyltransferase [Deltaproteobacteria bacterium]HNU71724.1 PEP-CTERM/exosortase system-associated acyltransferase [Thermodesulfobacteriota bacterium]HOC38410.1 PEP-CTERM/exosortase system-associated acyltransferase [Thermodesulfobacteriota bacterium]HQO79295.1 PEP-CTERM/exosortase system-associated acyltransferase [Thermodesulfobacteriota bacterium]
MKTASEFKVGNFSFVEAQCERLKEETYRLRYQVYAEEFHFEKVEDYPLGQESDQFEPHSLHFAALNEHNTVIGTIRLILPSGAGFPIARLVPARCLSDGGRRVETAGEISRLAVSKRYRRRQEDGLFGVESYLMQSEGGVLQDSVPAPPHHERRARPVILLGLFRIMYYASKRHNVDQWYMVSEEKLFYALRKYGFTFHPIGKPAEYHGLRVPYHAFIEEIERELYRTKREIFELMIRDLEEEYRPRFLSRIDNPGSAVR